MGFFFYFLICIKDEIGLDVYICVIFIDFLEIGLGVLKVLSGFFVEVCKYW